MARFPHREAELQELARMIIAGMTENPDLPSPPYSASDLQNALDAFIAAGQAQMASQATAQQDTETKQTRRSEMIAIMKGILHYAEDMMHGNDAKLTALGWRGRAAYTLHPLEIPSQPNSFAVFLEEDAVSFGWKEPADGGEVAFYELQGRLHGEGGSAWIIAGTSVETKITLHNQERGKEWEYRVIAVNKAGRSLPSNTVMVML